MKQTINRKIVAVVLIAATLGALAFWELWGRRNWGYDQIPVLKMDVEQHTRITQNMITYKPVENPEAGVLRGEAAKQIAGREAGQFIPAGEPLYERYFQESLFAVGEETGRYVLSVPDHWLQSYPQTMRRGDTAVFYCKGDPVTEAVVAYARDGNNQEVYSQEQERLTGSAKVSLVEVIVDAEQAELLGTLAAKGNQFVLLYY